MLKSLEFYKNLISSKCAVVALIVSMKHQIAYEASDAEVGAVKSTIKLFYLIYVYMDNTFDIL